MSGIDLIKQEREEHFSKHNRTIESDQKNNTEYQLTDAAQVLSTYYQDEDIDFFAEYPPIGWNAENWKAMVAKSYKERLIIAGSLIAAEIDRIS